jgi:CysZ protein
MDGVDLFFDGARIARQPGLARYAWLPALLSLSIIVAGLTLAFGYTSDFSSYLVAQLPAWLDFLHLILVPLIYLLSVLIGAWLFGFLAVIIASPFLGDLSIEVETARFETAPQHDPSLLHGVVSALGRELRKLSYYLPRLLVVLVLSLIPLLNVAAPLLWFLFGAWTLAIQFCDYPTENRGLPFRDTLALLKRHRSAALGFGSCATLAMAIPVLNFLMIPVAVAGGTLLHHRMQAQALSQAG